MLPDMVRGLGFFLAAGITGRKLRNFNSTQINK